MFDTFDKINFVYMNWPGVLRVGVVMLQKISSIISVFESVSQAICNVEFGT